MTQSVTQVNTASDNFQVWVNKTNEMADLFSTIVVTSNTSANGSLTTGNTYVNGIFGADTVGVETALRGGNVQSSAVLPITSNVSISGDILTVGNSSVNAIVNSSAFTLANSTVTFSINKPTAAQQASNNVLLNANGDWTAITDVQVTNTTTTDAIPNLVDSFSTATYYSAEYTVTVNDNNANNRAISKILVIHNQGLAYLTQYAIVSTNSDMGDFSANINSGIVRLYFTPTSTNTSVFIIKQLTQK